MCVCVCVCCHPHTVSLYLNLSDTLDASSWDRNPANFMSAR